jgi:hypothetical protein
MHEDPAKRAALRVRRVWDSRAASSTRYDS